MTSAAQPAVSASAEPAAKAPAAPRARSVLGSRLGFWLLCGALWAAIWPASLRAVGLVGFNLGVALLFYWDRARLMRARLHVARALPGQVPTARAVPYTLTVAIEQGPALRLWLEDPEPESVALAPTRHRLALGPGETLTLRAELRARTHGRSTFAALAVRRETALGLCALIEQHPAAGDLRAYPELPWGEGEHLRFRRREPGPVPSPRQSLGEGGEVERLREYVPTDSMRSIDWKATAKRGRPITRAYQPERAQTLWIVLDASRVMSLPSEARTGRLRAMDAESPHRTRFDASLEAALTLADAALAEGDRVGLLVYGSEAKLCMLPRRGRAHFLRLVEGALDLHAEPSELDTEGLVRTLGRSAPKRSLLVLFSDLDSEGDLTALAQRARVFTQRHLAICVSLSPRRLSELAARSVDSERDVYLKLSALSLLDQRSQLARALANAGLDVLQSEAHELGKNIVERYRRAKLGGRI